MRLPRMTWTNALAVGFLLRLLLVILIGPELGVPLLAFVVVLHLAIAYGVTRGNRLVLAFAAYAAATGIAAFAYAGLFPNPLGWYALGAGSVALTVVAVLAWRSRPWLARSS